MINPYLGIGLAFLEIEDPDHLLIIMKKGYSLLCNSLQHSARFGFLSAPLNNY